MPVAIAFTESPTIATQFTQVIETERRISEEEWAEIDKRIVASLEAAKDITEKYTTRKLDRWNRKVNKNVDEFLDWYFSFFHVKLTEFGVPFAWMAYKVDFLKVFRGKKEKDLNANQVIQQRIIEEFNRKFSQIVLNQEAQQEILDTIIGAGETYGASVSLRLSEIQAKYKIPNIEWDEHNNKIANLIYNTGTSKYNLQGTSFTGNLLTESTAVATAAITSKLAANFLAKASGKIAAKGSGFLFAESIARLVNPLVGLGVLVWDVWDYQNTVSNSRPQLEKNLKDYITEFKYSILENSDGTGIMDAISEVEAEIRQAILQQAIVT